MLDTKLTVACVRAAQQQHLSYFASNISCRTASPRIYTFFWVLESLDVVVVIYCA